MGGFYASPYFVQVLYPPFLLPAKIVYHIQPANGSAMFLMGALIVMGVPV
jgi:hypothetical protein